MAFSARLDMMEEVSDISSVVDASIASLIRSRLGDVGGALSKQIATALIPFTSWVTVLMRPFARYSRAIERVGIESSLPCMMYSCPYNHFLASSVLLMFDCELLIISTFESLVVALISGVDEVARLALVLLLSVAVLGLFLEGSASGGLPPGESILRV